MRKKIGTLMAVILVICTALEGCSTLSDSLADIAAMADDTGAAAIASENNTEPENAAENDRYTGNGSAWCSTLFENPSTQYDNQLALVAAEMSEKAEDTTGEGIKKLYSSYSIYACELYRYTNGPKFLNLELSFGGGAFAIGQDTLNIDGTDTTILIITARGTTTWGETFGDLCKGWYLDPEKVHSFLGRNVWDNVYDFEELIWEGINDYINKYPAIKAKENLKILVTGHSLGGAAANMVGARLTNGIGSSEWWGDKITKDDIYVYTFGAIKVLTTNTNVSDGYENIHNIYNYYDSYGPNGNQKSTNASSLYAKFGHTELYDLEYDESGPNVWDSCNSHLMGNYKAALENEKTNPAFIRLACADDTSMVDSPIDNEIESEIMNDVESVPVFSDYADFTIEGKWKSVGDYGFGQAQPGAIVAFDEIHCNFYSPSDTYALYQEDGKWRLDCTDFLFANTVSFTVEIIDNNNIDIYYGTNVTELRRVD